MWLSKTSIAEIMGVSLPTVKRYFDEGILKEPTMKAVCDYFYNKGRKDAIKDAIKALKHVE